jgi:hypothetical protein
MKIIAIDDYIIDLEGIKFIEKEEYGKEMTKFRFFWQHCNITFSLEKKKADILSKGIIEILKPSKLVV